MFLNSQEAYNDISARGFIGALSVVAELAAVTSCVESPGAGTWLWRWDLTKSGVILNFTKSSRLAGMWEVQRVIGYVEDWSKNEDAFGLVLAKPMYALDCSVGLCIWIIINIKWM